MKRVATAELDSLATLEAFERTHAVHRQLAHPQIARFVESFTDDREHTYAVIERVDGLSLAEEMQARRYSPDEVLDVLADMLVVLGYLHSLSPPVIVRDLTPSAIVRRSDDRKWVLQDLGGAASEASDGLTMMGGFGHLLPQRLLGELTPAVDLHALGVLAIVMLTRRAPEQLFDPSEGLKWRPHVAVARPIELFVEALLGEDGQTHDARKLRERLERVRLMARPLEAEEPPREDAATMLDLPSNRYLVARASPKPNAAPSPFIGEVRGRLDVERIKTSLGVGVLLVSFAVIVALTRC